MFWPSYGIERPLWGVATYNHNCGDSHIEHRSRSDFYKKKVLLLPSPRLLTKDRPTLTRCDRGTRSRCLSTLLLPLPSLNGQHEGIFGC